MTNENNCVLANGCKAAGSSACTQHCPYFIAMHGVSGNGGRSAAAGLPREYRLVTLQNSPARGDQTEAYKAVDAYAATFDRQFDQQAGTITPAERIKDLYLVGEEPGTGKTTTAAALLNEWMRVHYSGSLRRDLTPSQRPAYFLDVNEWQKDYTAFTRSGVPKDFAESAAARYYRALELAQKAPFVVLDDIGVRGATDGFRSDLHSIVNERKTNQLPTIYTSNVALGSLATVFGEKRLADRIGDLCREIEFVGESKRGMRR
ncbi:DNA replication protein [Bacillus spizizenii]|uniref:DNA replication protein n=1 Tax=Bacillus spizizenii TaxID=96241 RepID=UPI002FC81F3A